jgi:DNA-binding response OmpR family regulator
VHALIKAAKQAGRGRIDVRPLVLIAEDEPYIVESLTFLIERAGLDVAVAKDGALALQAVKNLRPAVMILDIMLPEENGLEVLRFVKSNPELRDTPVLVLTARGQENDRRMALALGADAFVTKPFSNREVVDLTLSLAGVEVPGAAEGEST